MALRWRRILIKFPYGISDFYKVITEDYFYVDRTEGISLLEEIGDNLLFLRPRRFGKSLLVSMLENYYDVNKADCYLQVGRALRYRRDAFRRSRAWLFHLAFKYVKLGEAEVTGEQARKMSRTEVAALKKVKQAVSQATKQVKRYRQHLQAKYGQILRLRSYVVVALGFERIVWLEVSDKKAVSSKQRVVSSEQ